MSPVVPSIVKGRILLGSAGIYSAISTPCTLHPNTPHDINHTLTLHPNSPHPNNSHQHPTYHTLQVHTKIPHPPQPTHIPLQHTTPPHSIISLRGAQSGLYIQPVFFCLCSIRLL